MYFRYLQSADCEDEQFIFEERGDVIVKGMKTPVTCYLLSRNLKKLPKVQLLLESNLAIGSRSPLLPSPGGLSSSGKLNKLFYGYSYVFQKTAVL